MKRTTKHDHMGQETLALLDSAVARADGGVVAILRHSARYYPETPDQEVFMTLTEEGKEFAKVFGQNLAQEMKPQLYSSCITRCMETAYLIGMGYAESYQQFPAPAMVVTELTPFYLNDIPAAIGRQEKVGHDPYLRMWFNEELPVNEIAAPQECATAIVRAMEEKLSSLQPKEVGLAISHDWNIFPVKEFFLAQTHEEYGHIGYLEAVVLFRENGRLFLQGIHGEKRAIVV